MTPTQYAAHIKTLEGNQPSHKEYLKKNQKEIEKLTELQNILKSELNDIQKPNHLGVMAMLKENLA